MGQQSFFGKTDLPSPSPRPPFNELSVLAPLLAIYTAAYLALMASDFMLRQTLDVPPGLMPIYIALLGAWRSTGRGRGVLHDSGQ